MEKGRLNTGVAGESANPVPPVPASVERMHAAAGVGEAEGVMDEEGVRVEEGVWEALALAPKEKVGVGLGVGAGVGQIILCTILLLLSVI